jgi:hypothetical protein
MELTTDPSPMTLLANRVAECMYPVLFVGANYELCHPVSVGRTLDSLSDSGERRDGLIVVLGQGATWDEDSAALQPVWSRWPRMRQGVQVFDCWNEEMAVRCPWLVRSGPEPGELPLLPSLVLLGSGQAGRGSLFLSARACTKAETLALAHIECVVDCAALQTVLGEKRLELALEDDLRQPLKEAVDLAVPWIDERLT